MKLEKILKGVDIAERTADTGMEIGELKYDSRQVQNGDVFVAITGYETDGHKYIGKAIELGRKQQLCWNMCQRAAFRCRTSA